ncbi:MAG: hypothetical protein Q8K00_18245 [Syntrophales bacterium]|nr:hypothetical protein [Syntrophales bacterium]
MKTDEEMCIIDGVYVGIGFNFLPYGSFFPGADEGGKTIHEAA